LHTRYKTPIANRQHTAVCKKQDLTPLLLVIAGPQIR